MKIGIVGRGHVGSAMKNLFKDAVVYDKIKNEGSLEDINKCDIAFICVPTPMKIDGSCCVEIVDEVLSQVNCKVIVLRSTVPVGYTEDRNKALGKRIVFQPEYYGETVAHPFASLNDRAWITLGGDVDDASYVANAYRQVHNSNLYINIVTAKTAELAKYMENAFLAAKVAFCNEFYDMAKAVGVNYDQLRETWLLDTRIGRSHTFVYDGDRGYGGSCLPKDMASIIHQFNTNGVDPTLISAVERKNKIYKG
ncbi:MAG: hypothetical protein R3Y32_00030 [Bacillota bacterium]